MYAIVEAGGRQHRVSVGDVLKFSRADKSEFRKGESLDVPAVVGVGGTPEGLLVGPRVKGAKLRVTLLQKGRDPKVVVFKKKRRKGYRRTKGHRQAFTKMRVDEIILPTRSH